MGASEELNYVLSHLHGVSKRGAGYRALCPAHGDKHPSLDIDLKGGKVLLCCRSHKCSYDDILHAANITPSKNISHSQAYAAQSGTHEEKDDVRPHERVERKITRSDVYLNADGTIFGRIDRLEPGYNGARKACLPYLYDPEKKAYNEKSAMEGKTFPLLGLPAVIACASTSGTVIVAEGEKCAASVAAVLQGHDDLCVTTLQGGSNKRFEGQHVVPLRGATAIYILSDSDKPGREAANAHMERIKRACPTALVLAVDFFPEDNPGKDDKVRDVADWLKLDGGKDAGALLDYISAHGVTFVPTSTSSLAKTTISGTYEGPEEIEEISLSKVTPESYEYIWDARIPKGILTLLCGDPAAGKSFVSLAVAAAISKGVRLPGNEKACAIGYTSIWNAEDSISKTTRRRADKMDADLERIFMIRGVKGKDGKLRPLTINDIPILEAHLEKAKEDGCPRSMLIIDPLLSLIGNKADTHKINEVTAVLAPLMQLAEKFNLAIVGVMHHRKSAAQTMLNMINGSMGFGAAARSVLFAVEHPVSKRRSIITVKSTNDEKPPPIEYGIYGKADMDDGKDPGTFWWGKPDAALDGQHLLEGYKPPRSTGKLNDAKAFLERELAEGPCMREELFGRASESGVSRDMFYRAQAALGIKPETLRDEKGVITGSRWALPSKPPDAAALAAKLLAELPAPPCDDEEPSGLF